MTLILLAAWAMEARAQVVCDSVEVPWVESFDSHGTGGLPPCWVAYRNYDMGLPPHLSAEAHRSGTAALALLPGTLAESHYSMAIAPPLRVATLDGLRLKFAMLASSTASHIEVGLCRDTGRYTRAFTPIDTLHVDFTNRWQEVVIDLTPHSGLGQRVAFRMKRDLQAGTDPVYIDDLRVEACGTSQPWVSHVGSTGLTLHFDAFGDEPVSVSYADMTVSDAHSPLAITGLQPSTAYTFSVGCQGGEPQTVEATTLEGAGYTPAYYQPFSTEPAGWRFLGTGSHTTGGGTLQLSATGADTLLAVLPLQEAAPTASLTLALALRGSAGTQVVVGVMEYAEEPTTFVGIDTLAASTAWATHAVPLAPYAGTGRYLALKATGGTAEVDWLRVARCMADNLRAYNLTTHSVTLGWDTLAGSGAMLVEMDAGTLTATANPFLLDGLMPGTPYTLHLHPACGDDTCAFDRIGFTTFTHEVDIPYCTGFEEGGTALPQGWVGSGASVGATALEGGHALALAAGGRAALPVIAVDTTVWLELWLRGSGTLYIGLADNPYATPTQQQTVAATTLWTRHRVQLANLMGKTIVLQASAALNIDNVSLRLQTLGQASVTHIGHTTAQVEWSPATGVSIEYKAVSSEGADFAAGTGTTATVAAPDTTLQLEGLQPNKWYALHIAPDDGCFPHLLHFRTLPQAVAVPYCINFNSVANNGYPTDWRRLSSYGNYPAVSTERNRSGRSLRFSATATKPTLALLPDIEPCGEHTSLAFWHNTTRDATGAMLIVGHLADATDIASFIGTDTILLSDTEQWHWCQVDLGADATRVAIMLVGGGSGETRTFVDDLCIEACAAYDIRASNTDSTTTIYWQTHGSTRVEYRLSSGGSTLMVDTAEASPLRIGGLEAAATYSVRLRALCDCGVGGGTYLRNYGNSGVAATDTVTTVGIHTHAPTLPLPWCTDFDTWHTGIMHSYWNRTGSVSVTDRNYASAGHSILIGTSSALIAQPTARLADATLSLSLYSPDEGGLEGEALVVGVMNAPDSATTFVPLDTLRVGHIGQWERHTTSLAAYQGTGRYLALRTGSNCRMYVDDLGLDTAAILSATVSPTGMVEWQGSANLNGVVIAYNANGSSLVMYDTAYHSPHTLTLPDPEADYDLRLTPLGGCMPLSLGLTRATTLPYCQHFDATPADAMPKGWLPCRGFGGTPTLATPQGGTQALHLKASTTSRSVVALPVIEAENLADAELSLSLLATSGNALLVVGQVDEAGDPETFIALDTLVPTTPGQWQRMHLPLTRHTGSARLALACAAVSQQAEMWADSVSLVLGRTPQVSATSARRLRLVCDTAPYRVAIAPAGTPLAEARQYHIGTTAATIDSLLPSTPYWVYPLYGDTLPTCEPPIAVATPAIQPLPFCLADTIASHLILPEPDVDALQGVHLYLALSGTEAVEVGTMSSMGDWGTFRAIDTVWPSAQGLGHTAFATYEGEARFIALRTLGGSNATLRSLSLVACPMPTFSLDNDNRLHLHGNGWVDYGTGRIGFGTDTIIGPLADTTEYWLQFYCSDTESACLPPFAVKTTWHAPLPYCAEVAGGLMPVFGADTLYARYRDTLGTLVHATIPNPGGRSTLPPTVSDLYMDLCPLPDELAVSQPGNGLTALGWSDSLGGFTIEYWIKGGTDTVVMLADEQPLWLDLVPDTVYYLRTHCQPGDSSCLPMQELRTLSTPIAQPYCTGFADSPAGALPTGWRSLTRGEGSTVAVEDDTALTLASHDGYAIAVLPQFEADSLRLLNITLLTHLEGEEGAVFELGAMTDANDPSTFDPIARFAPTVQGYSRCFHALVDYYGGGRFLALRLTGEATLRVDSVAVAACAAYNMHIASHEATYATLEWDQQGEPEVTIEYGPQGFAPGSGTVLHPSASPFTLDGLTPLTSYTILASAACPSDGNCAFRSAVDTLTLFSPQGITGCIDYTDLGAPYVSCNTGTYANPTAEVGVVDKGYQSPESRHTVHFDTTERDPRTGGLLRTVPEGHKASVRLGNWTSGGTAGAQAESITYAMTVDPDEADLLILKYAAVLQDPEHAPSLQPRFRLQILNSEGSLIDSCSMADFIANANLGWNQAPNEVLWKDWTTVGVDLTPYAGQSILIRLTTNDCGEGSHFGYAYFTLGCASRRMQTEGCSTVPSNRFTVPSGFAYQWHTNLSDSVLSTSASILVPSDNLTYICRLSFIDNPACHFTMSAFAGARFPLALFDTTLLVSDCRFTLSLANRSTISTDGHTPLGTGEPVERFEWLMPDGSTSTAPNPVLQMADTGLYTVQLVAGIANDQCLDTMRHTFHLTWPYPAASLVAPDLWCGGTAPAAASVFNAATYHWADGTTGTALLTPEADTLLTAFTTDRNGCADTLTHLLLAAPSFLTLEEDRICASQPSYSWHDTTLTLPPSSGSTEEYSLHRRTAAGCDSTHTLTLHRSPFFHISHADTLCHADTLRFFDTVLRTTGLYVHHDTTAFGCDSIVSLGLVVRPLAMGTDRREACDSLRWTDHRLYLRDTLGPLDTLLTLHGCDSIVTLQLAIHPSHYHLDRDTICQGDTLHWRAHTLEWDGFYADTLRSQHGCDSIRAIHLIMNRTPQISISHDYDCATLVYTLTGEVNTPFYSWSSEPEDSLLALAQGLRIQTLPDTVVHYTLHAWHAGNHPCPSSTTLRLEPATLPHAAMRATLQDQGHTLSLLDIGGSYSTRTWMVNHQPLDDHSPQLLVPTPDEVDTVWITLIADDGHCTDTLTRHLMVDRSGMAIPNTFTPDADDNRLFAVAARSLASYEISIYNRQGLLVFHSTDLATPWDGTNPAGQPCPTGSYVYHIGYTTLFRPEARQTRVGTVTLLR